MASPRVALIQQMLLRGVKRSPRGLPLRTSDEAAEAGDQRAPHHPPAQEERATRPGLSDRRHAEGEWSVGAILKRVLGKHPTAKAPVPVHDGDQRLELGDGGAGVVRVEETTPQMSPGTVSQDTPTPAPSTQTDPVQRSDTMGCTADTARIVLLGVLSLLWLSVPAAHALLITHSEAHVSNLSLAPLNGSITMHFNPWSVEATASAFDDPSGSQQAFDNDPNGTGTATAAAATQFASATSAVSSTNLTIDVVSDLHVPHGTLALTTTGSGTLFNQFTLTQPTDLTVSLDYTATLFGEADGGTFTTDYGINLVISDGINDFTLDTFNVLTAPGSLTDMGTLMGTFHLDAATLYAITIAVDPNTQASASQVPEASPLLLLGSGILALALWQWRRQHQYA